MRRGFKSEARREAARVRAGLGLSLYDVLDPPVLAEDLGIDLIPLSAAIEWCPGPVEKLVGIHAQAFSGAVLVVKTKKVILYNDSHAPTRQRSNLSHELAHILLLHEPHAIEVDGVRQLTFDREQEDEAAFFSGVLLVTDELCLRAARVGTTDAEFASQIGLSVEMARWRMGNSGARTRVSRERARRARP